MYTVHTIQFIETAVLSSKVINETHFQLYHTQDGEFANNNLPGVTVGGAFNGGGAQVGRTSDTENHYELQNYTTVSGGAHTWKFGVRTRAVTINNFSPNNFGGSYFFNGGGNGGLQCEVASPDPADCPQLTSIQLYSDTLQFIQGSPLTGVALAQALQQHGLGPSQFNITTGQPLANVNMVDVGAFVGDDWRVKPNLTLSLGLRFETQTDIHDWHDWAPRIGFAWAPGQGKRNPRPKTVFRGGFGIFYDRVSEQNIETAERFGTLQQQYVVTQSAANPIPYIPVLSAGVAAPGFPAPGLPAGLLLDVPHTIELLDSHLHAPYILQEALTVERQLPKNTTISESYVNSHGLHELRSDDINAPLLGTYTGPGTGVYPLASQYANNPVLLMESSGLFNQWQLITNVRSQLNKRISLNGFYMYGRAYSNTDGVNTLPANPYSMQGEYGPSSLDERNRVFVGGTITTWWGVLAAPFFTANSGAPFNVITGTDPYGTELNSNLFTARPTIAPGPGTGVVCRTGLPCLYTTPQPGAPVLGRNFGRSPGSVSLNFRLAKTFGFGGSRENTRNSQNQGGGGPPGGGGGRGGPGGGPGGGFAGGPGGGPGGFFRGLNGGSTGQRYNLTFSVQARNLLNHVNPGPINGIVTSPLFGESNNLAGGFGAFAQSGLNRRLDLQARFTF
jgi:hypothetical protein